MPASGTEAPATSTGGHRITWGDFHNIDLGSTPRISDLVGLGSNIFLKLLLDAKASGLGNTVREAVL